MSAALTYLAATVCCSGISILTYRLLLEKHASFAACRRYLLAAMVLSAAIPALDIPVWRARVIVRPMEPAAAADTVPSGIAAEAPDIAAFDTAAALPPDGPADTTLPFVFLYSLVAMSLLGSSVRQAARIVRLRRSADSRIIDGTSVIFSPAVGATFSFLGTVYADSEADFDADRCILLHEQRHIAHRHSVEKIAMAVLCAAMWIDPFVWIAYRLLDEIQEYEADCDVLRSGFPKDTYVRTICRQQLCRTPAVANGIRSSFTRRRLLAIGRPTFRRRSLPRIAAAVPVFAALVTLFGFTSHEPRYMTGELSPAITSPMRLFDIDGRLTLGRTLHTPQPAGRVTATYDCEKYILDIVRNGRLHGRYTFEGAPALICEGRLISPEQLPQDAPPGSITVHTADRVPAALRREYGEACRYGVVSVSRSSAGMRADSILLGQIFLRTTVPDPPDQMPSFDGGGVETFQRWVSEHLTYPAACIGEGATGQVLVRFMVLADGSVGLPEIVRSPHPEFSEAVIDLLSRAPRWTPARRGDRAVVVEFMMPVNFRFASAGGPAEAADTSIYRCVISNWVYPES